MSTKETALRVIVLDGLDWEYVNAHPEQCPELWALAKKGCHAPLHACDPPITPTGVAALLSGRVMDRPWVAGDWFATSQEVIRSRPWFGELHRHDLTVGLCNVPMTWPAPRMPKGSWVVSGFPIDPVALAPNSTRPWYRPDALDVKGYPIDFVVHEDHGTGGTQRVGAYQDAEGAMVKWLLNRAPRCDVEILWLVSTDRAGHHLWGSEHYAEAVRRASSLVEQASQGAQSVLVISDHGFDALGSDRCAAYRATTHGPASASANLLGGHAEMGVLFAAGDHIHARGLLPEQRLDHVAGGIFDVMQVPPAPGMVQDFASRRWSAPLGPSEEDRLRDRLRDLGYVN